MRTPWRRWGRREKEKIRFGKVLSFA